MKNVSWPHFSRGTLSLYITRNSLRDENTRSHVRVKMYYHDSMTKDGSIYFWLPPLPSCIAMTANDVKLTTYTLLFAQGDAFLLQDLQTSATKVAATSLV